MKKGKKMQRFHKWFMITVIAWVSLGAAVAVLWLTMGKGKFSYHAKFTEFFVCEGPDPITGFPRNSMISLSLATKTMYACGYLEAAGPVPLHYLLFYEGKSTGWFDPTESYRTGYVVKEIPQSWWRKPGDYRVEVWLNRQKLASTEFTIVP